MLKFDYSVPLSVFLSVILLTGTAISGFTLNSAFAQVLPTIDITDVSMFEGDGPGTIGFVFNVNLDQPAPGPIQVNYATVDITAQQGSDYVRQSGILFFNAGDISKPITIQVIGNTSIEPNEEFRVRLSNAIGATLLPANEDGIGIILNDDGIPRISINDITINEGNSGTSTAQFTVSLTQTSGSVVTVNFASANGNSPNAANAGTDYIANSGLVSIPSGQISAPISITINGDTIMEPNEEFFVNLLNPINAIISDSQGIGTIQNDDVLPTMSILPILGPTGTSITVSGSGFVPDSPVKIWFDSDSSISFTAGEPFVDVIVSPTGQISGIITSPPIVPGTYYVSASHTTPGAYVAQAMFTSLNTPPIANPNSYSTDEDTPLIVSPPGILLNDSDPDGTIPNAELVDDVSHGTLLLETTGNFAYTPNSNFNGVDSFTYKAYDDESESAPVLVTITVSAVDDIPATNDDPALTDEDVPTTTNILANDSGLGDGGLIVTVMSPPTKGITTVNQDKTITYTPNADLNGADSYVYQVADADGDTDTATVSINITPVNDIPTAVDDDVILGEDSFTITHVLNDDVLGNNPSIGDQPVIVTVITPAIHGAAIANPDDTITYAPNPNYFGPDSYEYVVTDANGDLSTALVNLVINPINDAPIANNDSISVIEDTSPLVTLSGSDIEGIPLTFSIVSGPSHGSLSPIIPFSDTVSKVVYVPNMNYHGPDSFTFKVNDGTADSNIATISITVIPANDAPTGIDDSYSVDEDSILTVPARGVLGNDSDIDGDALTAQLLSGTLFGTVTLNPDGSFTYATSPNFNGADSFTYRASDGTDTSNTATVSINVISVNDLPMANDDSATTLRDTPVSIPVLANDSDVDGTPSILSTTIPTGGTVSINPDGTVTYTPNTGFSGTDSFSYTITDGADTDSATVTITVTTSTELFCGLPESSYNVINGNAGNNNLSGTSGADLIRGFGGDDKIKGKGGADCLIGGDGSDKIWGGDGDDTIQGDADNDKLYGNNGNDTIFGGDGNDKLWGGNGDDIISGEIGYDRLYGGDGADELNGGDHNDKIFGGKGNDDIDAGAGNDEVHANQDNDTILGGAGNDWLGAGKGDDIIFGGDGADKLFGRDGNDILNGAGDDDQIHGGSGNDSIDGGETPNPATDNDRCLGGSGTNSIVNCEVTLGGSDDSEESGHDNNEGEDEESES